MIHILKHILNHYKWKKCTKKFASIGSDSYADQGFSIIHGEHIYIGDNFSSGRFLKLQTWEYYNDQSTGYVPSLEIGNDFICQDNVLISCMNNITIGNNVLLGDNVFISDNLHGDCSIPSQRKIHPIKRPLVSKGPINIGSNVWIGRNVCIMGNVNIGDGAVIGANAVVTHDIPANSVAVGCPAKIIKKY